MADVDTSEVLPNEEEQSSAPLVRALFALAALWLFRWSVYGQVSMATTKEINAREQLQALLDSSQAALRTNRYEDAVRSLEELTRIQPKNHVYWWEKATVLGALARRKEEAAALEAFVKVSPLPGEACPRLGFVYRELGMKAESLDAFKRCAAFSPNDLQDAFYLGHAYEREQQVDEAYAVYTDALKKGYSGDLEAGLGRMLLRKGKPAAALAAVQPTLARNPNHVDALLVSGIALSRTGKIAQAKETLERGARLHDDTDFEYFLGVIADWMGARDEAIAHYRTSLSYDPNNRDARARLDWHLPRKKQ